MASAGAFLMGASYKEKPLDPRWQKKRLEVFERDGFQCQFCGSKERTLNVHHKKYTGEPWEAPTEDLETLCVICHKVRGEWDKEFRALPTKAAMVIRYVHTSMTLREMILAVKYIKFVRETPEQLPTKLPKRVPKMLAERPL